MRIAAVCAAVAVVAGIVWISVTDDAPEPTRSGSPATPGAAVADARPADSPTPADQPRSRLPSVPARDVEQPPEDLPLAERPLFTEADAEARDPAWATATEASIRERVDGLLAEEPGASVPQLECRETVCRLLVTSSDEGALRRFAAELNSERGFVGSADMLAFENVEHSIGPDGVERHAARVMLVYRR